MRAQGPATDSRAVVVRVPLEGLAASAKSIAHDSSPFLEKGFRFLCGGPGVVWTEPQSDLGANGLCEPATPGAVETNMSHGCYVLSFLQI